MWQQHRRSNLGRRRAGGSGAAVSALYPKESEEKRLLDAMLMAVPRN
jgi:hypothetical protein